MPTFNRKIALTKNLQPFTFAFPTPYTLHPTPYTPHPTTQGDVLSVCIVSI
ncbi:MAG: hypothetical protein KME27_16555 [Lyngbya sp. HA4199-MV5]|nr:hypothetical protein [Lyngbya sp. HA4199-MV5]